MSLLLKFSQLPRQGIPVSKLHESEADPRRDGNGFCESTKMGRTITTQSPTYRTTEKRTAFETAVPGPKYNPYPINKKRKKQETGLEKLTPNKDKNDMRPPK